MELEEPQGSHCNEVSQMTRVEREARVEGFTSVHRTRDREGHRPPEAILGPGLFPDLVWDSDN